MSGQQRRVVLVGHLDRVGDPTPNDSVLGDRPIGGRDSPRPVGCSAGLGSGRCWQGSWWRAWSVPHRWLGPVPACRDLPLKPWPRRRRANPQWSCRWRKRKPRVRFTSKTRLVVNVDPDLPRSKNWKIKLQRKSTGKWRKVGIYRTRGQAEIRKFKVKKGTYRVKVYARPGYRAKTTKAYRFAPTTTIPPPAPAGPSVMDTTRVSVRSDGGQANAASDASAVSADGRWIAYTSKATNLVDDDTNGTWDVFLFDRDTGLTQRVSVNSDGDQADYGSGHPAISADGRWIAYDSGATNLVDDDSGRVGRVPASIGKPGLTQRVSVHSGGRPPIRPGHPATRRSALTAGGSPTGRTPRTWSTTTRITLVTCSCSIGTPGSRGGCRSAATEGRPRTRGLEPPGDQRRRPVDHLQLGRKEPGRQRHQYRPWRVPVRPGHRAHPAGIGPQRRWADDRRILQLPAISGDGRWISLHLIRDEPGQQRHQQQGGRVPVRPGHRAHPAGVGQQQRRAGERGIPLPGDQRRRAVDHLQLIGDEPGQQ